MLNVATPITMVTEKLNNAVTRKGKDAEQAATSEQLRSSRAITFVVVNRFAVTIGNGRK